MYLFISVLIIITCVLLGLIVLVQNSKGGGLAANFSSQNQIMGVRKTADFLEKATWTLVGVLLFLSLLSVIVIPKKDAKENTTSTELTTDGAVTAPTAIPAQQQQNQGQSQQEQPQQPAQ